MRKLAKVMEVSHTTAMTATRNLGMTSYVRRKRQLLSSSTKLLRVKKGKKLVNWMRRILDWYVCFQMRSSGLWTRPEMPETTVI
ncbi:Hypothetical protein FKW44_001205 [Caligus rogercresseyi]|uniref:Uncharacterized protein n=1 Tax=Caligus rogercresseyi TaxID=217165 RepID=A0A7T8KIE2_CALRO|nr:Hypothetical protein FKW44_001205 [Caligus rogercresseyi]